MKPLKICIDARLSSGEAGGVEQFIIGLATGLSQLTGSSEEYWFLAYADSQEWIKPFLGGSCRLLEDSNTPGESLGRRLIRERFPGLLGLLHGVDPRLFQRTISQEKSSGLIEGAGMDVMHFTMQNAFLTEIPSIYHPHDLQHIHLPEVFSVRRRVLRDQMYRTFCNQASMVAAVSRFVKDDLIKNYQLAEEKVKVVPLAPVVTAYSEPEKEDLEKVRQKFSLPENFIFYPAQTWPHKNHIGLLDALAFLKTEKHVKVEAVFSGRKAEFYNVIERRAKELGLEDQVSFLDFVDPMELRSLYRLCRGVVIPTKFEAASFPLWEAFSMGVPAACSNVTSLPEQAGDAALLFDPDNPQEMACQIHALWTDEKLRAELVERGRQNVARFSWERTARTFRAHYRRIARRELTEEDQQILSSPSLF